MMNRQKFILSVVLGWAPIVAWAKRRTNISDPGPVGGGCDGCDLIYEGMPTKMANTTHLPDWSERGKRMIVEGTVYHKDGRSVAPNVIVYLYHTDSDGHYSKAPGQVNGKRHGHIRGWIKTGCDGKYKFYTTMPAAYPGRDIPAHIHPVVKEPGINEYYIDDYCFEGDPLLTQQVRSKADNRGGNGIVKPSSNSEGLLVCRRDIVLGLNIPNYR